MYVLFEISDKTLIIIGIIFVLICLILFFLFRWFLNKHKPEPIGEEERFDKEDDLVEKKELTEEQIKAKEELERVYNQMSADLEASEPTRDEIDDFEREQEENAIISYKELMKQASRLKEEATKEEAKDVAVTQLNIDDVMEEEPKKKEVYHGFKNSDIISPIYGIQREKKSGYHEQVNRTMTINHEKEDKESVDKQQEEMNDFLNSLKEFRKNL